MGTQPSPRLLASSFATSSASLGSASQAALPSPLQDRLDVLRHFDAVFSEAPVSTPTDIEEAFRLRYLVYCLDRGFEDAHACPDGQEKDPYDDSALHCLLRDRIGKHPLGTVRLVLADAQPGGTDDLPLAEYAPEEGLEALASLPAATTAEVSRFAIARSAREILRRSHEDLGARLDTIGQFPERAGKLLPYMSLGLIRGLVRQSMQNGITHWCLAAEPSLLRRLRGFGLHFRNAGPLVDHRGLRQVCYAELKELLAVARTERPEFWDIITVGGFLLSDALVSQAA
jgi:N-acyl amino acid synthase of PEP-CTERM/exosortase system